MIFADSKRAVLNEIELGVSGDRLGRKWNVFAVVGRDAGVYKSFWTRKASRGTI